MQHLGILHFPLLRIAWRDEISHFILLHSSGNKRFLLHTNNIEIFFGITLSKICRIVVFQEYENFIKVFSESQKRCISMATILEFLRKYAILNYSK